jgi:hypothetical protein
MDAMRRATGGSPASSAGGTVGERGVERGRLHEANKIEKRRAMLINFFAIFNDLFYGFGEGFCQQCQFDIRKKYAVRR